jgi:DNA-binding transcriptional regulator GbsR (MarR family)
MSNDTHPAVVRFIERLGLHTETEGLPRIAGRIMALLLVERDPCTFDDIARRLRVSRGSVSTNTRLLETLGMIERITLPGDRHDHFQLSQDRFGKLLQGYVERMGRMVHILDEAVAEIPKSNKIAHGRLSEMSRFYHFAIERTNRNLADWRTEARRSGGK